MRRHPSKQRYFKTKLKHRLKLNARYNPISRIRITVTETFSPAMTKLFKEWAKFIWESFDESSVQQAA